MTLTILTISLQRLWNNKQELVLALLLPMLFFSIFALIFSRGVGNAQAPISVAIVDDDQSELSRSVARSISQQTTIKQATGGAASSAEWPIEKLARALLSQTQTDLVVHIPSGYAANLQQSLPLPIRILEEGTNPVGLQVVRAVLSQAVAVQLQQVSRSAAAAQFRGPVPNSPAAANPLVGNPLVGSAPQSFMLASAITPAAARNSVAVGGGQAGNQATVQPGDLPETSSIELESQNVFSTNKHNPKIAMYAAGIAVMFLLFSASGAGGSLLEEREAGTLERLLASDLSLGQLLLGKWLFITGLGLVQLLAMFCWGQFAFGVDLLGHLPGFFALAVPTAAAAASFALVLAAVCKSRNQLNGISVILVLSMSAVGGSMIPRYIMSESMQRMGKLTFNGWALDGFKKIFWYDLPVSAVSTEIMVLSAIAICLGVVARLGASRWSATV